MRTSILSRSVIAIASLAITSAALAATPATAATAPSVTRDLVLTAANGLRLTDPTEAQVEATFRAMQRIAVRSCALDTELGEFFILDEFVPVTASNNADGLLIRGQVGSFGLGLSRDCTIAAFTATDPAFRLSGSVNISGVKVGEDEPVTVRLHSGVLAANVYVTKPIDAREYDNLTASASGSATKTTTTTTSTKVSTPKSAAQKKAAKKKYNAKVKAAKKKYAKAGKTKKAKQVMTKSISRAKKVYKSAIASFKIVKKTTSKTDKRPFSITTALPEVP